MSASSPFEATRLHDPLAFHGRVEMRTFDSPLLAENALGDPSRRELSVYLPPGCGSDDRRFPVFFVLAGYTGRGQAWLETHPWRTGWIQRYDRAVVAGELDPAILVLPDAFTALGGSQYVNSSAVGPYADHITEEIVPWVLDHDPVLPGACAVLGKSSGGIGALHLAMQRPGRFDACASISGDAGFELLFPPEFSACLRHLVTRGLTPRAFLDGFFANPDLSGDGHAAIISLAVAACYSPNPASDLGFDLPFDLETGELVDAVWQRWLAFDPLRAAAAHAEALRSLRSLHIECGLADEYHLQWGARRLSRELNRLSIPHDHVEHPGSHRGIDDRYLFVIEKLTRALT